MSSPSARYRPDSCVACCGYRIEFAEGVAIAGNRPAPSYFDDKYEVMQKGHSDHHSEYELCYKAQLNYIEPYLQDCKIVVDVGCGPGIRYRRGADCRIIGLEPSFNSIRANKDVDLRVCGDAKQMPFKNHSIDAIICFYSIHHMVGWTVSETRTNVRLAFNEFARVLKPEGDLFIAEMTPGPVSWLAQRCCWNVARTFLRGTLDQFFWARNELVQLGQEIVPQSHLEVTAPSASPWLMVPPIFSLPWLKIPRLLFPLQSRLFHWKLPSDIAPAESLPDHDDRRIDQLQSLKATANENQPYCLLEAPGAYYCHLRRVVRLLIRIEAFPFVCDNNETFSSLWHAHNLFHYPFWETYGVTEEASSPHPEAHPMVHTHQGNFPLCSHSCFTCFMLAQSKPNCHNHLYDWSVHHRAWFSPVCPACRNVVCHYCHDHVDDRLRDVHAMANGDISCLARIPSFCEFGLCRTRT